MSFRSVFIAFLFVTGACLAQSAPKPSFEVASVKQAEPMDAQKLIAAAQAGGRMPVGPHVTPGRAEYRFMSLTALIAYAYKINAAQISGPEWLPSVQWDIVAKMPEGASAEDAPAMLQTLLEERFKLSVHRQSKDQPVLALVLGKGPLKLQETEAAKPFDADAPFKPGEVEVDEADGPTRMYTDKKTGETVADRGANGMFRITADQASMTEHIDASGMTMAGFADILSQFARLGNSGGRGVVDMTGLKGSYNLKFDINLSELVTALRARAAAESGGEGAGAVPAASDPGGVSIFDTVAALGLKLEPRKAPVEQLVVDHVEKTPIEN